LEIMRRRVMRSGMKGRKIIAEKEKE